MNWALENAQRGFYLYTASPLMQRQIAERYNAPDVAIYDYSKHSAPYSFGVLAQWAEQQKARVYFVINMQVALQHDIDVMNLNLSRDLLSNMRRIWVFGMTPDAEIRLIKKAKDFYSFIRNQIPFEDDETIEKEVALPPEDNITFDKYHDSYDAAEEQMQRYKDLCEEYLTLPLTANPERLLSAAMSLDNISELYYTYGHYDYAMKLQLKIKDIREKVLGKDHPDTARTYHIIANICYSQGDFDGALEWYFKALAIREGVLGKDHPDTAATYNNIANIYDSQGDYTKALEGYERALTILEGVLGKDHPNIAATYNNIAGIYYHQRDYVKALEWCAKALAIREGVLGKDHPDTVQSYNNIANIYSGQGDYTKALELYEKNLVILERVLGKDHPAIATTYNSIAVVYMRQGDYEKALMLYLKSYLMRVKSLGEKHPDTVRVRGNMERAYGFVGFDGSFEDWLRQNS